ncbi:D-alanyl-D-alanine carboxypeptidase family protein [Homoserinibacter sp. YIM 151385]|uniref:D-alanyl-D-alanine carboxypeptidase family protein n=1 Tax=Homoserinibacter sp. YIM 151385 TaxID=2985506 RepID=UPI0022F0F8C6|nr:D-alanyl-D-alanine carboxypeptidase [Homoserinibacter sp. YIM 151385]WBU38568.1 D-alanyl-D-alanine carboxypeptidase [Homoserinibacter sp. YIM 151385]
MPLTRRQIYRRRRAAVFGTLAAVLATAIYLPLTLLAPLDAATAVVAEQPSATQAAAELDFPGYGASAIGALDIPGVLAQDGQEKALPIASITKVVTALVALDAKPLGVDEAGPSIEMTAADAALYDRYLAQNGSVVPVAAGLAFTQRELLELTLVKSANNYAGSLAIWSTGSLEAFRSAAAAWLAEHGLENTVVVEPTGLSADNRARASDLVELGRIALRDPVVREIVGTSRLEMHDLGQLRNTNALLGDLGVDGIKTGTLGTAANLLFSSTFAVGEEEVTVVGVVLGGPGPDHGELNRGILALLKTAQAGFREVVVAEPGQVFASYRTEWGQRADAVAAEEARIVTWSDSPVTTLVDASPLAVTARGAEVGSVIATAGDRQVEVALELSRAITDPGASWRLTNPVALLD